MLRRSLQGVVEKLCVTLLTFTLIAPLAVDSAAAKAKPKDNVSEKVAATAKSNSDGAEAGPFAESTTVQGKIDVDVKGVWLLVAMAEFAPGKLRTFPQLLKITQGKSGPEFHMLDVQLPDSVQQAVADANRTLSGWTPSDETRKQLAKNWLSLPKATKKDFSESLYDNIQYLVASPDRYQDAFSQRTDGINKALDGSKFGMKITERYKPRDLPPNSRIIQVMGRTTYYGVKTQEKNLLKGELFVGFLGAASAGPLPYQFNGPFTMYRLASL
jgi:hypothetical protein